MDQSLMTVDEMKDWKGNLLTNTSKMPCKSLGLPAERCITGSKLAKVKGSVCHGCYALKGNYQFKNVKRAQAARIFQMESDYQGFEERMIAAIEKEGKRYFRWHDSGDIQGREHLQMIFNVCNRTPKVMHWIPTREYKIVRDARRDGLEFPPNLIIRASAPMVDGQPPSGFEHTSTVHKNEAPIGKECRAYTRDGECGKCRACWDFTVANVSYPIH